MKKGVDQKEGKSAPFKELVATGEGGVLNVSPPAFDPQKHLVNAQKEQLV